MHRYTGPVDRDMSRYGTGAVAVEFDGVCTQQPFRVLAVLAVRDKPLAIVGADNNIKIGNEYIVRYQSPDFQQTLWAPWENEWPPDRSEGVVLEDGFRQLVTDFGKNMQQAKRLRDAVVAARQAAAK